ncbi:MAG: hypothetical protein SFV55_06905 [Haliscomenobacter sp.]|uniref:hypothetical protein n=1 Tax=Haliscomenobacter sp. TaxID=2717303 RepID=UPI0029B8BB7C|nr:hypothetical protein [Haliscomenobacter sp.]MDX2068138.1 hypothetical protein [Haliscomenobacter sp.]
MDYQYKNLQSLVAEFRNRGKASKGFNHLIPLIANQEIDKLDYLLRYHDPISVYKEELIKRFEIDTLIEFYNLLLIAALTGYIPNDFTPELRNEIVTILNHKSVKTYYEVNYPDLIISCTSCYVANKKWFEPQDSPKIQLLFNQFASLNRAIKNDEDIERFLGMLDFVLYGENGLNQLKATLLSVEKTREILNNSPESNISMGIRGFIKYAGFMGQLRELMQSAEGHLLIQSGMWLFHGYYLNRLNIQMKSFFDEVFENIKKSLIDTRYDVLKDQQLNINTEEAYMDKEVIEHLNASLNDARDDAEYILNIKWAKPFEDYFFNTK